VRADEFDGAHVMKVLSTDVFDSQRLQFVNPTRLKKMALARQVGSFLRSEPKNESREAIENVAMVLAEDISDDVRSTLAFELRLCEELPWELTDRIARDIEQVAAPFLMETPAMSGEHLAQLIPELQEFARVAIARRRELASEAQVALVEFGGEESVTYLVRNTRQEISSDGYSTFVNRFSANPDMMDKLSERADLPLTVVEAIIDKVSAHCRDALVDTYKVNAKTADKLTQSTRQESLVQRLQKASDAQVHAYVRDLRDTRRLTHKFVLDVAERGVIQVMESALALEAELTISEVRMRLRLDDKKAFVEMLKKAGVTKELAPRYLALAKKHHVPR